MSFPTEPELTPDDALASCQEPAATSEQQLAALQARIASLESEAAGVTQACANWQNISVQDMLSRDALTSITNAHRVAAMVETMKDCLARIAELDAQLTAERTAHLATSEALAQYAFASAPLRIEYPVCEFIKLSTPDESGLVKMMGRWAEDGSPYFFYIPHQLVECFIALQQMATQAKAARVRVAKAKGGAK